MPTQFFTIGLLMLLSSMLPGPDFALVTKNTVSHSRRAGFMTSLGVGSAIIIHITYCILGLAVIISESALLFNIIKYIGAGYLIFIGIQSLLSKPALNTTEISEQSSTRKTISDVAAFRQGFLCNLLNPKATLFFLALFTVIITPGTPRTWLIVYAIEMVIVIVAWFSALTMLLSHPSVMKYLNKVEIYISKVLGVFLIVFGVLLCVYK